MSIDGRRITLITRGSSGSTHRVWNTSNDAPQRIIFVNAFTVLRYALVNGPGALAHDVGRVIVDGSATAAEFLELLSELPHELGGDVLLIHETHAFLSASGRGAGRVLYSLKPDDVDFYLITNGLLRSDAAESVRNPNVFRNPSTYGVAVM